MATGAPVSIPPRAAHAAALVLLALMAWMADSSTAAKSPTFDETAHLTAGFSYWATGDMRLDPENGVVPQAWAALPLWLTDANPPQFSGERWRLRVVWLLGQEFLYDVGNDLPTMLRQARRMVLVFGLALGVLVYFWSSRLFGPAGGLLSLWVFVFSPNVLAHARLVTSDAAASLAFPAAIGALWWAFRRVTLARVALAALAAALLFLTKFAALLFLPMALVLTLLRVLAPEPLEVAFLGQRRRLEGAGGRALALGAVLALVGVGTACAIWSAHGFAFRASFGEPAHLNWPRVEALEGLAPSAVLWARDARLLPETWLYGLGFALSSAEERVAFANGAVGSGGWWWFFPYTAAIKTPLATLALMGLAAAAGIAGSLATGDPTRRARIWRQLDRTGPLWVLILVYGAAALGSNLNIGVRHVLPPTVAALILTGAAIRWTRTPGGCGLVALLLVATAAASWSVRPHYLAFFNRLAGGPEQGHRHLIDSNLDWGQDLPGLASWLAEERGRGDLAPCYLSYFGSARPAGHGVDCIALPGFFDFERPRSPAPLQPGIYAVSATMLQALHIELDARAPWSARHEQRLAQVRAQLEREARGKVAEWTPAREAHDRLRFARLMAFLREREPDAQVGYSILIYRLDADDLRAAATGPLAVLAAPQSR